jgi:hypothetical protein
MGLFSVCCGVEPRILATCRRTRSCPLRLLDFRHSGSAGTHIAAVRCAYAPDRASPSMTRHTTRMAPDRGSPSMTRHTTVWPRTAAHPARPGIPPTWPPTAICLSRLGVSAAARDMQHLENQSAAYRFWSPFDGCGPRVCCRVSEILESLGSYVGVSLQGLEIRRERAATKVPYMDELTVLFGRSFIM